jgi:hypothetical protein
MDELAVKLSTWRVFLTQELWRQRATIWAREKLPQKEAL